MLKPLIASRLVTAPAIWGKLPAHADFVRSGVREGESEGWEPWLARHGRIAEAGCHAPPGAALPAAFVLPPGTLPFAPRRFVVGVAAPSVDRVGRTHALLVYQLAHPRWVARHFALQAQHSLDWLFWLAQAIARHAGLHDAADIRALERTVDQLWRLHAPGWTDLLPFTHGVVPAAPPPPARVQALLDRMVGRSALDHPAVRLSGVRHLPWADWPERLQKGAGRRGHLSARDGHQGGAAPDAPCAFWQQDAAGGFVNAASRLDTLWTGVP